MSEMKNEIRCSVTAIIYSFMKILPIDNSKIVFSSYFSTKYNDNPRAIFERILKDHPEYHYYWLMRDTKVLIPGATVIKAGSLSGLYHLATAKCWVDNSRKRAWVSKRKQQFYVQTWHAGIAFKRVEKDVEEHLPKLYVKAAKNDSKMADVFISGSKWQTESYKKSFWYNGEVFESGLPRSDIFFEEPKDYKEKVYKYFGIEKSYHLLLYAPTFRVNETLSCYDIDYKRILDALREKFNCNWKILVRLHPNISKKQTFIKYDEDIINASNYQDINELIVSSSILISDYSSCLFDAMEARKIVLLYANDIDDYMNDRGMEFSLREIPFPLATNNDELETIINDFDLCKYQEQVDLFSKQLGIMDDGKSSERVADYILSHIGKE